MSTVVRTESCFILQLFHVCHMEAGQLWSAQRKRMQSTFGSVVGDLQSTVTARDPFIATAGYCSSFYLSQAVRPAPAHTADRNRLRNSLWWTSRNDRDLGLVQLEVDNLPRFRFPPRQFSLRLPPELILRQRASFVQPDCTIGVLPTPPRDFRQLQSLRPAHFLQFPPDL